MSRCCIVKGIASELTLVGPISDKVFSDAWFSTPSTTYFPAATLSTNDPTPPDDSARESTSIGRLPIESGEPIVPAFGCIVYFARENGVFRGRVANLAGIEVEASSQREMLGQIVARFKAAVAKPLSEGAVPAWIEPPAEKHERETKLFLPVHL